MERFFRSSILRGSRLWQIGNSERLMWYSPCNWGSGGLVVAYDKEQLRDALQHILGDDKMRLQFGEKGKLLVREKFNWEKIAEQVEDVYMDCLLSPTLNYEKQT